MRSWKSPKRKQVYSLQFAYKYFKHLTPSWRRVYLGAVIREAANSTSTLMQKTVLTAQIGSLRKAGTLNLRKNGGILVPARGKP